MSKPDDYKSVRLEVKQSQSERVDWKGVDIGPETVEMFQEELQVCKTVLWNGPMGVCEIPLFCKGTSALMEFLAARQVDANVKKVELSTIIGGGETTAVVEESGLNDIFTLVSTGGGATLEYLEGKILPGVDALLEKT